MGSGVLFQYKTILFHEVQDLLAQKRIDELNTESIYTQFAARKRSMRSEFRWPMCMEFGKHKGHYWERYTWNRLINAHFWSVVQLLTPRSLSSWILIESLFFCALVRCRCGTIYVHTQGIAASFPRSSRRRWRLTCKRSDVAQYLDYGDLGRMVLPMLMKKSWIPLDFIVSEDQVWIWLRKISIWYQMDKRELSGALNIAKKLWNRCIIGC